MPPQTILANATPTSGSNNSNAITTNSNEMHGSGDSNNNTEHKSNKLKPSPVSSQQLNGENISRSRSPIPSLQWPWSRAGTYSATMTVQGQCKNAGNTTLNNIQSLKKRNSSGAIDNSGCKKSRSSHPNVSQDNSLLYNVNSGASKRLKAAALEESQTKITGYFKSQMKGQMYSTSNEKKIEEGNGLPTSQLSNSGSITTPLLTPSSKTAESVNTQIIKNLKDRERQKLKTATCNNNCQKNNISFFGNDSGKFPKTIDQKSYPSQSFSLSNTHKTNHLQKLEKSKTTKIAQVAPNLRKTPTIQNNSINSKSPKKPVAIAPRTLEVKLQQLQPKSEAIPTKNNTPQKQNQQKTVLLTAIRLPGGHQISTTSKTSQNSAKLLQNAEISLPGTTNGITGSANSTLYQLPSVQIPNLVQFPQLITSNGANVVQFQNIGGTSVAKTVATTATTSSNTTHAGGTGQYILNGTLFKLQQYTSATTTTASAISASTTANQYSFLTPTDIQQLLSKQHQQKLGNCNHAAAPAANVQDLLQQQILAAIANQQQQQFQHLQRLTPPNLQQSPLFMATPTGVLLNTTSLPVMFAQTPSVATSSQQGKSSQLGTQNTSHIPVLHPLQSNGIPALSPIFPSNAHQQDNNDVTQQQQQSHQLAQISLSQPQFLSTTQPPPLSAVTITSLKNVSNLPTLNSNNNSISNGQNNIKLSTTKANFISSSQPPPLITISTLKTRITPTLVAPKQVLTKSCQKRQNKSLDQSVSLTCSKGKITAGGLVIATSTTPPPLVPTSSSSITSSTKDLSQMRASNSTVSIKPIVQTPALVSILSIPSLKRTQNLMSTVASINSICEPPISPKNITDIGCTSTSINLSPSLSSSSDLFDLVKNDRATSIETASNCLNSDLLSCTPSSSTYSMSKYTHPMISKESKIKNEIIEDMTDVSSDSLANEGIKEEPFTVNSDAEIKGELIGIDLSSTDEITQLGPSLPNECSSSSFNSNSVSSAPDLSLDPSRPASICSSSGFGNSEPEAEHKLQNPTKLSLLTQVPQQYKSNYSPELNNKSPSANIDSSQQILNDRPNSSGYITSGDSEDFKSLKMNESHSCKTPKRNMPSPESGICSSLSNSECGNSDENSTESAKPIKDSKSLHDYDSLLSKSNPPSSAVYGDCNSNDSSSCMSSCINDALSTATESIMANMTHISGPISLTTQSSLKSTSLTIIDTKLSEVSLKCAISPILSQPKTIRFPAEIGYGVKGGKRHDGVCYWDKCNKKHDNNSKLLDHMQCFHVNSQNGPFVCLWVGCKVYNKKSCSRRWLERHVLSHGGSKQFKCIVEGCGLRFGSQLALQKHVNNHFTATDSKEQSNKRTTDPPVPKQLRKNGKKLRYRRQPFSARMFDFFDAGIMEGLQHRLRQINTLTNGSNSITFQGYATMRRKTLSGDECYVKWSPPEIIPDEWVPESIEPFVKTVNIKALKPAEKTKVESLLTNSYKLRYSSNLFKNNYYMSDNYYSKEVYESSSDENNTDTYDDDNGNDSDESFSQKPTFKQVLTIAKYQETRKHLRKPRKYNTI